MKLRSYQERAIEALRKHMRGGLKRLLLVSPTGSGKTVMFSAVVQSAASRGNPALVLAHRKELIDQTHKKLASFGVQAGVIMADDPRFDDYLPVQVASVQTLARRMNRLPPAKLVVIDEAHHAASESYQKIIQAYPDAIILGATATPWRSDKKGLGDIYEDLVVAATPAELIASGALTRYEPFAYDAPDLHAVGTFAGDFKQKELALACNTSVLVGNVVREYLQHAGGRRGIVFPVDVKHSKALVKEFIAAGVAARHLDAETPREEREAILEGLAAGDVQIVASVGVLTEGFDCPGVEFIALTRPTKSLALYMQMVGRGLRPHPGKDYCLVHDHGGNLLRHGFPDDERDYSLRPTPKRIRELGTCPICRAVFGRLTKDGCCPKCGEVIGLPQVDDAVTYYCPDHPNGIRAIMPAKCPDCGKDLVPVPKHKAEKELVEGQRLDRTAIEKLRERSGRTDLTDEQLARAVNATRQEKAAEYLRLKLLQERKGMKPAFIKLAFRDTFGETPKFTEAELAGVQPARYPFLPLPPRKEASNG